MQNCLVIVNDVVWVTDKLNMMSSGGSGRGFNSWEKLHLL